MSPPMIRTIFGRFFENRGTHFAAIIAYFALLSFVPLVFLAFALLAVAGRVGEESFLVEELQRAFPSASIDSIVTAVETVRDNATALGIAGGVMLLWSSL